MQHEQKHVWKISWNRLKYVKVLYVNWFHEFFVKNEIYEQISRFFMHSNSGNHCTTKNSITLKAQCTNCTSFSLSSLFCKNAQICILQNIRSYISFFHYIFQNVPLNNNFRINTRLMRAWFLSQFMMLSWRAKFGPSFYYVFRFVTMQLRHNRVKKKSALSLLERIMALNMLVLVRNMGYILALYIYLKNI